MPPKGKATAEEVSALAGVSVDAAKIILACSGAEHDPNKAGFAAVDPEAVAKASGHSRADCAYVLDALASLL